jgi:hypothetical protein
VLGGAVSPLVAAQLAGSYGTNAVGLMIAAFALLSLVCALVVGETRHRSVDDEPAGSPAAEAAEDLSPT